MAMHSFAAFTRRSLLGGEAAPQRFIIRKTQVYVAGATLFQIVSPGRSLGPRALASQRERLHIQVHAGCGIEV